jgi:hypothetical protein
MLKRVLLLTASALVVGEIGARSVGLGSPPLSVAHPTIEYLFAPNQDVLRFHNRIRINQWGMRSDPVEKKKSNPTETRVLALGDSVLNGGVLTDQSQLATTILSSGGVRILNVSAGSWGPGNMLAYVETFGFFDSDRTVIVLSSHDAYDVPTFAPLDPDSHPTRAPISGLYEGIVRYLPRSLPQLRSGPSAPPPSPSPTTASAIPSLVQLLFLALHRGPVCVILHSTQHELRSGVHDFGYENIERATIAGGADLVEDAHFTDLNRSFRDDIHLSAEGQQDLAEAIKECLKSGAVVEKSKS